MKDILSTYQSACRTDKVVSIVAIGLIIIACLALYGMITSLQREAQVAYCASIDGAEWNGNACYYDGIKLNFKEGYDAPEED